MTKVPQSREEILNHRDEQVGFIRTSAAAFDSGSIVEAKRISSAIRMLVHDTKQSHAIYSQLGELPEQWLDTAGHISPGNLLSQCGLIGVVATKDRVRLFAPLDDRPFADRWSSFDEWWTSDVYRSSAGDTLSRRGIILGVCNKDGGAHVDPELNREYEAFSRSHSMGVQVDTPQGPVLVKDAALHAVRQIAHEVLRTIDPTFRQRPPEDAGGLTVLGASLEVSQGGPPDLVLNAPVAWGRRNRRNLPCPCGSGRKYKRCHGK